MTRRIATAAVVFFIGLLAFTGIAKAQGTPGTGNTTQTGNITISETISMVATLPSTFTLTPANYSANNPGVGSSLFTGGGSFTVTTNDPAGYNLDVQGPASFKGTTNPNNNVPTNNVSYGTLGNNVAALPTTLTTWASNNVAPLNPDSYTFSGYYLNTQLNEAPDTYAGTVQWTLWGN